MRGSHYTIVPQTIPRSDVLHHAVRDVNLSDTDALQSHQRIEKGIIERMSVPDVRLNLTTHGVPSPISANHDHRLDDRMIGQNTHIKRRK
jgi:hypothetical protein